MDNNKLNKYQRELLKYLGDNYTVGIIDSGECIYRDLGDFDIEIIGGRTPKGKFHVFVWKKTGCTEIVERYFDIDHDLELMDGFLNSIVLRYKGRKAV